MCLPAPNSVTMARCSAAWPLAVAIAPTPPSSAATRSSSTATVGLEMREIHMPGALDIEERRGMVAIGNTNDALW